MATMTGLESTLDPTRETALEEVLAGSERVLDRAARSLRSRLGAGLQSWLGGADLVVALALGLLVVDLSGALAVLAPLGWVALLFGCGSYAATARSVPAWLGRGVRTRPVLLSGVVLGLGSWVAATVVGSADLSARLLLLTVALTAGSVLLRAGVPLLGRSLDGRAPRVLVVGGPGAVGRTVAELRRTRVGGPEVASVCLLGDPGAVAFDVPTGVGIAGVVDLARTTSTDAVLVLPHQEWDAEVLRRLAWELERTGTDLLVGTDLLDVAASRTRVARVGGLRLLHVRARVTAGATPVLKDVVERTVAAFALLVLAPVLLGVAVVVRRGSRGPALFRQERVGRDGRSFTMYKFRTMVLDAPDRVEELAALGHDGHGLLFKLRLDPRVTPAGRVLRRFSLDELPQLLNVVLGQMSLVGPRPALPREVALYDHDPRRRLVVKPGLTGLWQVSGRSDLSWEESIRLDLQYVDNWSLGLDLAIAVRTLRAVVSRQGAY